MPNAPLSSVAAQPVAFVPCLSSVPTAFASVLSPHRIFHFVSRSHRREAKTWLDSQPPRRNTDDEGTRDDEGQQPPSFSGLFSLDGPASSSTNDATMLRTNFPSEGPLYEYSASIEERLSQELDEDKNDDNDAPFLSEADYKRASMGLGRDGSIQVPGGGRSSGGGGPDADAYERITKILLESDAPPIPPELMDNTPLPSDMSSDEILLSLASTQGNNKDKVDEDLHRRVMMDQNNDEIDSAEMPTIQPKEKIEELVASKRNESYRRHRDEALAKLEQEMEKLMASLPSEEDGGARDQSTNNDPNADRDIAMTCDGCGCKLSPIELDHAKSLGKGKKHLCQACNVERFIEKRPYAPDIPLIGYGNGGQFGGRKLYKKREMRVVKKQVKGPAQTYRDDNNMRNSKGDAPQQNTPKDKRASSLDPSAWRARYSGQPGGSMRQVPVSGVSQKRLSNEATDDAKQDSDVKDLVGNSVGDESVGIEEDTVETLESEWVQAEDPDTGEYFFWNESTGEMRMDVPF